MTRRRDPDTGHAVPQRGREQLSVFDAAPSEPDPSQTDPDQLRLRGSRLRSPKADLDLFGRVPTRFVDALLERAITYDEFTIGSFLCVECFRNSGKYITTTSRLRDALGYSKTRDSLRNDLHALRGGGWIDFELTGRQRRPFVIYLRALNIESRTAETTSPSIPQTAKASRQSVPQSAEPATPGVVRDSASIDEKSLRSRSASGPLSSSQVSSNEEKTELNSVVHGALLNEPPTWEAMRDRFKNSHPDFEWEDGGAETLESNGAPPGDAGARRSAAAEDKRQRYQGWAQR